MSGAAVDIISGRPMAEEFGQRASRETEAGNLMDQMRLAGISRTDAYRAVVQKVMEVLEQRIATVLNNDPQAKVCLDILRSISAPEVTAQDAARRYVRRFNPLTPALGNETTPEKEMFP
jgi:hypothetical protein